MRVAVRTASARGHAAVRNPTLSIEATGHRAAGLGELHNGRVRTHRPGQTSEQGEHPPPRSDERDLGSAVQHREERSDSG